MDEWSGMWLKWRSICSKDRYQPAEYHGDAALPLAFSEGPHLFLDPSRKTACEASMGNSDDDYNGGQLVVVAVIFLALTYISVFLRFFVRLVITKSFSADDWLMLAAQVLIILATCREAQTHNLTDCFYAFLLFHSQRCARWTRQTQSQPPSRKQNQSTRSTPRSLQKLGASH